MFGAVAVNVQKRQPGQAQEVVGVGFQHTQAIIAAEKGADVTVDPASRRQTVQPAPAPGRLPIFYVHRADLEIQQIAAEVQQDLGGRGLRRSI